MRVKFFIGHKRNSDGERVRENCPVFMSVTYNARRLVFNTGIRLRLDEWDVEKRRVHSRHPEAVAWNELLDSMTYSAQMVWQSLMSSGEDPDPVEFRALFRQKRPVGGSGFFPLFFQFMEEKSRQWNRTTYLKVRHHYKQLGKFQEESGRKLTFPAMDTRFLESYAAWMKEQGYRPATTRRNVNILVWFLNWATREGYNIHLEYKGFYRKLGKTLPAGRQPRPLFLTENELDLLAKSSPEERTASRVRDLFCLSAYTGITFAELARLTKSDIAPDMIRVTGPRGKIRQVPLGAEAAQLCLAYTNRYYPDNRAFPYVAPLTYIRRIRRMAEELGLNRPVVVSDRNGEPEKVPLFSVLSPVTAVNTFITRAIAAGWPDLELYRHTGIAGDKRVYSIRYTLIRREKEKSGQPTDFSGGVGKYSP